MFNIRRDINGRHVVVIRGTSLGVECLTPNGATEVAREARLLFDCHFGDKEECLLEAYRCYKQRLSEMFNSPSYRDPQDEPFVPDNDPQDEPLGEPFVPRIKMPIWDYDGPDYLEKEVNNPWYDD